MPEPYPRDLVGYGGDPPVAGWPNGARLALSFVLNYEEGGEASVLHGDPASEVYLHEVPGNAPRVGARDLNVELVYEYGARAGFWRILRLFTERRLMLTVYAVGMALERNPQAARAMTEAGFEVASHGWRWIDYHDVPEHEERADLQRAIQAIERTTGQRPVGWYTGRISPRTRRLVVEEGGFLYDFEFIRRRPAVLGRDRGQIASDRALYARQQRHEVRRPEWLRPWRGVFPVPARRLRCALRRRSGAPEDDVGRAALPAGGSTRARGGADPLHRLRPQPRPGMDHHSGRNRPPLAPTASAHAIIVM